MEHKGWGEGPPYDGNSANSTGNKAWNKPQTDTCYTYACTSMYALRTQVLMY